mmetsp:Transcript_31418/g.27767  ORF Transcript_31418/g.27767 Transcript_31418/m.27767 type:complete len:92 (+) Transcript_31418:196-471(+)
MSNKNIQNLPGILLRSKTIKEHQSPKNIKLPTTNLKLLSFKRRENNKFFFKTKKISKLLIDKMKYFYAPYQPEKYKKFILKGEEEEEESEK